MIAPFGVDLLKSQVFYRAAQSMVYQGWRLAGSCTTLVSHAGYSLSAYRDLYWLFSGDGHFSRSSLTSRSVLELVLRSALLWPTHLYFWTLFRIDALLFSSKVKMITLLRLERVKTCMFVATDVFTSRSGTCLFDAALSGCKFLISVLNSILCFEQIN